MTTDLLSLINSRQKQAAEFNYGIQTADRYVSTLSTCVGSDLCYRYGSTKSVSFNDALKRASRTLTYSNPDMLLKDVYSEKMPEGIEIPKHALMVFKHILTTPRKDRDGDILRTKGARPDPSMLMLWQHVHTLPIGKSLGVAEHTDKELVMISAIVDVNELAQDAAVMIANKMGRFSHGFKALEFSAIKEGKAENGKTSGAKGFDVTRFEIMEESLVSVPANVDAETLEVYLDLIEGEKLTSSIMKSYGKKLRATRSDRFPGMSLGEKHADTEKGESGEGSCGCGSPKDKPCSCQGKPKPTSEKTDDGDSDESKPEPDDTEDDKVTECPECGVELEDGVCPECGYVAKKSEEKTKGYFPNLTGSFEQVKDKLQAALRPYLQAQGIVSEPAPQADGVLVGQPYFYCFIESTFVDTVIAGVENGSPMSRLFEIKWRRTEADGVEFYDDPVEVEVTASISRKKSFDAEKAGRVLSKSNYATIKEVHDGMEELTEHCSTRSGKALCQKCQMSLKSVLDGAQKEEPEEPEVAKGISFSDWLVDSSSEDRKRVKGILEAMDTVEANQRLTKSFQQSVKKGIATSTR